MFVLNTHVQRSRRYGFLASNARQHKPAILCQGHLLGLQWLLDAEKPLSLSLSVLGPQKCCRHRFSGEGGSAVPKFF